MLVIKNLSFSYGAGPASNEQVIRDLDMELGRGEYLTIAGPNGSGKSTLAALIKGLLVPQRGEIRYLGEDVTGLGINHRIGYLFSNPENQIVSPVVEDDVAFGPENYGMSGEDIYDAVESSLAAAGCSSLRKELTHQLSGGEQQSTNMAGIAALDLDCIIFDEAASMLDPLSRRGLLRRIRAIRRSEGLSVIQLTHKINDILSSDRVIVLDEGRVAFNGRPEDLIENEQDLKLLGVNQKGSVSLLRRLLKDGIIESDMLGRSEEVARAIGRIANDGGASAISLKQG